MEFDRTSWEAFLAQFELPEKAYDWTPKECVAQLATSLKELALEILGHLSREEQHCYRVLVEALQSRYGTCHQKAKFRTKDRGGGEALQKLAQDLERMAHGRTRPRSHNCWLCSCLTSSSMP